MLRRSGLAGGVVKDKEILNNQQYYLLIQLLKKL